MTNQVRVVFMPSGKRADVTKGRTILDVAREIGVDLDSVCGGRQRCSRCQVSIGEGAFAKLGFTSSADHVSAWQAGEDRLLKMGRLKAGRRLGCTACIEGDLVVDIPPESQVHRQIVRKDAVNRLIDIDPVVRLFQVKIETPSLHARGSHASRLKEAMAREWGLEGLTISHTILGELDPTLTESKGHVSVAVRQGELVVGVWPDSVKQLYGLAVDIGTTTISGHLCALDTGEIKASQGLMNPQIRFGEDLMSRVSYVQMNPGALPDMVNALRKAVGEICQGAIEASGVAQDHVVEIVMVGNPIMHHFMHGFDPTPLGLSPFPLASDEALSRPAQDFDLPLSRGAQAYTLPCIAGHVGADAAGVALSEAPHQRDDLSLIIDVGTNAEILLGNRSRVLACSSPTGPAFEGAQISSGQRAAPGAIERFRVDHETLEPRYKVIGCDAWSDEDGFAEATQDTGVTGICGSGIIEAIVELLRAGVINQEGVIVGAMADKSWRIARDGETFRFIIRAASEGGSEMSITQLDVRNIQLAKAAVYAGAKILMEKMNVTSVDRVILAGAFGAYIDPLYAMALGLVPDCPTEAIASAGNAAGTGAQMALLNQSARKDIEALSRQIDKVETAVEPTFQAHFIDAMGVPHRRDAFPHLEAVLSMPPRLLDGEADGGRRRRRRDRSRHVEMG